MTKGIMRSSQESGGECDGIAYGAVSWMSECRDSRYRRAEKGHMLAYMCMFLLSSLCLCLTGNLVPKSQLVIEKVGTMPLMSNIKVSAKLPGFIFHTLFLITVKYSK